MNQFKIGDRVEVIDVGAEYTTYRKFFNEHKLSDRLLNDYPDGKKPSKNGEKGVVLFNGKHNDKTSNVVVIRKDSKDVAIFGTSGLELIPLYKSVTVCGELFSLTEQSEKAIIEMAMSLNKK